nr:TolC family protein [Kofleriaceae bacterium]
MLACATLAPTAPLAFARGRAASADAASSQDDSDAPESIALADVLTAAVRKSPGLAMARADRSEAAQRVGAADIIDAWHVLFRATGQDAQSPAQLTPPGAPLATRAVSGELGLSRSLSTGGDVSVAVATSDVQYLYPIATGAQVASPSGLALGGEIATLRLTATQPLVRGAGDDAARAGQKLQKLAGRQLAAEADDEAAELVRQLVVTYWELAYSDEELAVDREGEQLAVKQVAITAEVVRTGMQPPSANQIAQLQVALRREAILRDETQRDDHSLTLRRLAGLELAGAPLQAGDDSDDASPIPADRVEADVVAAAQAHGPGLAQKRLEQTGADVQVAASDNATLPKVDLSLTGEVSGVADDLGTAFDRVGSGQMYSVMGGLTVQWDIGGGASAAAGAAHVHRARLEAERADLDRQLEAAAMSASRQLARARERAQLSVSAVDVAREALRAEIVAFQAGRSTTQSVFQRQDDLSQAKLRLARARIDAIEADVLVDYLTGGLLARYGITVADKRRAE